MIVNAYFGECQTLVQQLSQSASRINVSAALAARVDDYMTLLPSARVSVSARHDRMPYRVFLAQIGERLRHTYAGRANGYEQPRQFRADVQLIADSLSANKGANAGLFFVRRLLRRIDTFGFHIATLDVRQHTGVHHQMVARGFDDPHWRARPREERRQLLGAALEGDVGPRAELDPFGKRSLSVFDAVMQGRHRYGADASGADDVLAALLLARWAEAYDKRTGEVALDFAPMFESIESLERCGETMRELLDDPRYRRHLEARGRKQCVLIGYSDTNKEAGLCASRFAIHQAQRSLAQVLTADHESHVICHGRGGSIARGGGRIDVLVRSAPAEAVNGVLRLTEQGEVMQQSYGLRPIAMRTLERAFNALSLCTFAARNGTMASDDPQQLECAATIAAESRAAYRRLVHGEPAFYDYFRLVTPIDVIERMQIAARPVYRAGLEALGALRAVPWVFAWTQARHMLPGWYGAGTGLRIAIERFGLATLRAGYANWFFLRNLIDDTEAMLARADLEIAQAYNILAPTPLHRYFADIRLEYAAAREQVLAVKNCAALLDTDPTLQRALQLRNPYVDPMNLMQVDLLRRWRASERADRDLFEALLASISGIAQGLQSTG
jgi:phosphoenolpyruvate carboxylase